MRRFGVLVISHGSREEHWVRLVDEAVAGMNVPGRLPVFSSFLEIVDGRLIQDGIRHLESLGVTDIIVVPLFVSSGSTHIDEIRYALGVTSAPECETELKPFVRTAAIHWCPPLDDDREVAEILADRVRELSVDPCREVLLLIGHGSGEAPFARRWLQGLRGLAEQLKALCGFQEADTALLLPEQAAERMTWWRERKPTHDIIVAPVFLSQGYFTRTVIPGRLKGFSYRYNGKTLLPHPLVSRWMEKRVRESLMKMGWDNYATGDR